MAFPKKVIIEVSDHGTVVGFYPKTKDAGALLRSLGASSYQWMGETLYMDHRVAQDFIEQVSDEGGVFLPVGRH